jgi:hypothetical protein
METRNPREEAPGSGRHNRFRSRRLLKIILSSPSCRESMIWRAGLESSEYRKPCAHSPVVVLVLYASGFKTPEARKTPRSDLDSRT